MTPAQRDNYKAYLDAYTRQLDHLNDFAQVESVLTFDQWVRDCRTGSIPQSELLAYEQYKTQWLHLNHNKNAIGDELMTFQEWGRFRIIFESQASRVMASGDSANCSQITHPSHYTWHPSGIECKTIAQAFCYNLGTTIAYIWRAGFKSSSSRLVDLKKARRHLDFEIALEQDQGNAPL